MLLKGGTCGGCPIDFSRAPGVVFWETEETMKTWLTIRLEGGKINAKAYGREEFTDGEGNDYVVNESVEVELTKVAEDALKKLLNDSEAGIKKALSRAKARTQTAVEDALEGRGVVARAAGAAKKAFRGGVKARGEVK